MTYRTVIFDLDGTLLDTLPDLTDSTNYALVKNGLPPRTADEVRLRIGGSIDTLIKKAVPEGTSPELTAQCLADCNARGPACDPPIRQKSGDPVRPSVGVWAQSGLL